MKKQYKSSIIKNKKITNKNFFDGGPSDLGMKILQKY